MGSYVPSTQAQREQMLRAVGLENVMDLYRDVPEQMLLREPLRIPDGMSELEAARAVSAMAAENRTYATILRGAGAYDHYIPSIVKYIPAKEEFLTAYTPYQAEMSQGLLQSIFEYQTMICELTGMDVSNASVYDGATAAAEAAAMCRERKRRVTLISGAAHPDTINTVRTYCYGTGDELRVVPVKDGRTDMDALRDQVAMVLQKNVLFSGTIKENLRWGNPDATDEELVHACRLAQADDFIRSFPDGYDTKIEQGGTNVSGGQKQRLCIARAILRKPKILILDDSTSAVDTKTDALIRRAFREEIPDTTKIIIAQRISSVMDADQIIVMDNGLINGRGTHEELLASNEIYREVYESQQKGGLEE